MAAPDDEKKNALEKLRDLAGMDKTKYPPGYLGYWAPNPAFTALAPFYLFPGYVAQGLEQRGYHLNRCYTCLANDEGHDNDWAVPWYAGLAGIGHNGKVCEDPCLACLTIYPLTVPCVWLRNNERIELEMIGDRQMWPRAVWGAPGGGGYMYSEHCEGHLMANYCTCLGLCAIPFCVNCCVGGCDYCCCYMAARRRKLRIRYKLKGNPCMDYCFAGCLPFFLGFLAGGPGGLAAYQEAMELGKQQGYEIPYTTIAGGPGVLGLLKKKDVAPAPAETTELGRAPAQQQGMKK